MLRGIPFPHVIYAHYYLNQDPDQHIEHWYKKETFLKAYNHFIQPISNMMMWSDTTNPPIEPPKSSLMLGRPDKNRRKSKDEPKKCGELSKNGVKMTCSIYKKISHNKAVCARARTQLSQQSFVCGDTTVVPRATQTGPGTSSDKILHGPTKLKSASPTNINIGFRSCGLKLKGKDAVNTSYHHSSNK
ncbi:hypothetical protein H5410_031295 [Solanum commersonii]|uniref:Uncharacterized protein n=1 Tax=Solanum commersonii TaxID=4109 RepID=A0A9J5YIQ7_SOLCO|nr:hypothetical protein H5410_031295 [Solanum commersonii]